MKDNHLELVTQLKDGTLTTEEYIEEMQRLAERQELIKKAKAYTLADRTIVAEEIIKFGKDAKLSPTQVNKLINTIEDRLVSAKATALENSGVEKVTPRA